MVIKTKIKKYEFSTITLIRANLSIANSRKTGGGRKIYAKIDLFSTFLAIKVQNVLYLVREI